MLSMDNELKIHKEYPEFGYSVDYRPNDDNTIIGWEVMDENNEILMNGVFKSADYYRSTFNIFPANIEENVYENLFYLYFENIKLVCIDLVEGENINEEL